MEENTNIEQQTEIIDIKMDEAFPYVSSDGQIENHSLLKGRELSNQHPFEAIYDAETQKNLKETLSNLDAVKRVYAKGSSFAEFKKWQDNNPSAENRAGYFVYIVPDSDTIAICGESNEVYGVTTTDAGFVSNQVESDRSDDWTYSMVSLIGAVKVRADETVRTGDYVVPNAYGEATISENNYGYKVLSMGSYPEYNYAVIALVPQSSTLNKVLGSLSDAQLSVGEILIRLDDVEGKADTAAGNAQIALNTSQMSSEEIDTILKELENQRKDITTATDISNDAKTQAEEASSIASQAQSDAVTAVREAQAAKEEAVESANQAVSEVSALKEDMTPLAEWCDDETGAYGVAGSIAQADSDHTLLASVVSGGGANGTDLTAIKQTQDMIQHLVSHIDKYSIGEYSLSYGLSLEEANNILQDTYIYVPTNNHEEQMGETTENGEVVVILTFKRGYAYTWDPTTDTWTESAEPISTATEYKAGSADGDLWYCWQSGITQTDADGNVVTTYDAGTLYRWSGTLWLAVATVADNYQGRVTSNLRQTSDSLQSDIVALDGRASTIEQNVNNITTRVGDAEGNISIVEQRVDGIAATVYCEDGTTSRINQHSDSINQITAGRFHVVYQ